MHPHWLFLLYIASNSGKRYWDCKLPCIEAQIELSSTFVYDYKMSTSTSSAKNSHLSRGGGDEQTISNKIAKIAIFLPDSDYDFLSTVGSF